MPTSLRVFLATIAGFLVTLALAYLGAAALLLARIGIPLGSPGWEPTRGDYAGLLAIAGGAAATGGHIAAGIAQHRSRPVLTALAVLLAGGALWGFVHRASQWPWWWAPSLAAIVATGAWLGGAILRPQHTVPQ